jgi:NAD-dependent SIR2 family protein deacetylase
MSDPEAAWGLYGSRMRLYLEAVPHRGFQILSSIARQKQNNYFVFTSNIDGQFLKSGFDEKKLFESHGYVFFWFTMHGVMLNRFVQHTCLHAVCIGHLW